MPRHLKCIILLIATVSLSCLTGCGDDSSEAGADGSGGASGGSASSGGTSGGGGSGTMGGTSGGGGTSDQPSFGGLDCAAAQPTCGGDPTGTWVVNGFCYESLVSPVESFCPGATLSGSVDSVSGSLEFTANGNYIGSLSGATTLNLSLPSSCLAGQTCEAVSALLAASGGSCTAAADGCDCSVGFPLQAGISAGTWINNNDGTLTITDTQNRTETVQFCVEGNNLTWRYTGDEAMQLPGYRVSLTQ